MTTQDLIINLLNENKDYFTRNKGYILPEIPEEKLSAIKSTHQLFDTEEIIWAVDRTLSGNATDSTILTNYGISFKQTILGTVTEKKILWTEIEQFYYDKKKGFVFLNNKGDEVKYDRMDFDVFYKKDAEQIDVIVKAFEQIVNFVKLNSAELPLSENEKKFMDDVKFMLEDDGKIVEAEQRILDKMVEKYGLEKTRADEIIAEVTKDYASSEEMEYLDEVKNILKNNGEIGVAERRVLEFFRQKLEISKENAEKLEKMVIK